MPRDIRVHLEPDGPGPIRREQGPPLPASTAGLDSYLYLCLGARLDDFPKDALRRIDGAARGLFWMKLPSMRA